MTSDRSSGALRLVREPAPKSDAGSDAAAPQTWRGELRLGFAARAGATRLVEAYQAGCLRARTPKPEPGGALSAVLINTGGGVAGGDRLRQQVRWGPGASATVASQAAEKVYRSLGADSVIETHLDVAAGAAAEWLPQETILFDRSRLARCTQVDLAEGASFLGLEAVILGRTAMGEQLTDARLSDRWRIRRGGRLIYADAQRLAGPVAALMDRPAIGAGARAMAVMVHVCAQAPARLAPLREALDSASGRAAASAFDGLLVARFLADDGQALRRDLLIALASLRDGRAPPRVWTC